MKKTISSLNEKAWYRFLKVAYIFSFIIILFITIINIWFEVDIFKKIVVDKKVDVICKQGNKKTFDAKEKEVHINISDIKKNGIGYFNADKILDLCEIEITYQNNCKGKSNKSGIEGEWERKFGGCDKSTAFEVVRQIRSEKEKKIKVDIHENVVDNEYYKLIFNTYTKNKGGWIPFLGFSILSILGIIVVFEIIKRTFYYIVLGSINPEK